MDKASLVGLDEDGTALILAAPGGLKLVLPIDEALRAALRADRSGFERAKVEAGTELRPREIQAEIRAGESPEDLAERSGMDLAQVMKYAAPVLDERAYVASRAVDLPVAHDLDAPTIGALVRRRLLSAGVAPEDIQFDAARIGREWRLIAHYGERAASWRIDLADRMCEPRDEAARRLISGEDLGPVPTRHLAAVHDGDGEGASRRLPHPSAMFHPSAGPPPDTGSLLDDLDDARGVRAEIHLTEEFEIEPAEQADAEVVSLQEQLDLPTIELPTAEPPRDAEPSPTDADQSRPDEPPSGDAADRTPDASPTGSHEGTSTGSHAKSGPSSVPSPDPDDDPPPPPVRPTSRPKRASVPSWDEIVFGAKPE